MRATTLLLALAAACDCSGADEFDAPTTEPEAPPEPTWEPDVATAEVPLAPDAHALDPLPTPEGWRIAIAEPSPVGAQLRVLTPDAEEHATTVVAGDPRQVGWAEGKLWIGYVAVDEEDGLEQLRSRWLDDPETILADARLGPVPVATRWASPTQGIGVARTEGTPPRYAIFAEGRLRRAGALPVDATDLNVDLWNDRFLVTHWTRRGRAARFDARRFRLRGNGAQRVIDMPEGVEAGGDVAQRHDGTVVVVTGGEPHWFVVDADEPAPVPVEGEVLASRVSACAEVAFLGLLVRGADGSLKLQAHTIDDELSPPAEVWRGTAGSQPPKLQLTCSGREALAVVWPDAQNRATIVRTRLPDES